MINDYNEWRIFMVYDDVLNEAYEFWCSIYEKQHYIDIYDDFDFPEMEPYQIYRSAFIPDKYKLPIILTIYLHYKVDYNDFLPRLKEALEAEPYDYKQFRIQDVESKLKNYLDNNGNLILYRRYNKKNIPINKAISFTYAPDKSGQIIFMNIIPDINKLIKILINIKYIILCPLFMKEYEAIILPQVLGGKFKICKD
jgi:hypothetical protein